MVPHPASVLLYTHYRSSATCRIRMVLNYKNIKYENKFISLLKQEQNTPEFEKVNINKRLPVLVVDGNILKQSVAIAEYLEEVYSDPPLMPKDALSKQKVREIVNIIASDAHPMMAPLVVNHVAEVLSAYTDKIEDEKFAWSRFAAELGLSSVEKVIQSTAGEYAVGNNISLADIFITAHAAAAGRWKIDLSNYPTVHKIFSKLVKMEPIKAALPENQPDVPAE